MLLYTSPLTAIRQKEITGKILHRDSQILSLRPGGGRIIATLGVLSLLMIPFWIYFLGQSTTLTCKRTALGALGCALERTLLGITTSRQPLGELRDAYVAEYRDSDGDRMYQVILRTGNGDVPFIPLKTSSSKSHVAHVTEINLSIADQSRSTFEVSDGGTAGFIAGGIEAVLGIGLSFLGLSMATTTWTFERQENTVTKRRVALVGVKVQTYALDDIVDAQTATLHDGDGGDTYCVELVTRSGRRISLTPWYSGGYVAKERTAQVIRDFLNQG